MAFNNPAVKVRQWTPTVTTGVTTIKFTKTGMGGTTLSLEKSKAILFCNDETAGGNSLYIALKSTVAAPTDGEEVITLRAGETIRFDIETSQVSLTASAGTVATRVIVTFEGT